MSTTETQDIRELLADNDRLHRAVRGLTAECARLERLRLRSDGDMRIVSALFQCLPAAGQPFPKLDKWLAAMRAALQLVYREPDPPPVPPFAAQEWRL